MKGKPLAKKKAGRAARAGKASTARTGRRPGNHKPARVAAKPQRVAAKPRRAAPMPQREKGEAPAAQAAPEPAPAPERPDRPDTARPRALAIAEAGLDKKAEDVVVIDVRGLASYADYFVVMTAESEPQASAIADNVDEKLKASGAQRVGVEGHAGGRWVLIDYGDVVAHVFSREARGFYDLEGLWADARRVAVEG